MLTFTFTMELKADDHENAAALADALVEASRGVMQGGLTVGFVEDCGEIVASWEVTGTVTPKCDWCGKPVKSGARFCAEECKAVLNAAHKKSRGQ